MANLPIIDDRQTLEHIFANLSASIDNTPYHFHQVQLSPAVPLFEVWTGELVDDEDDDEDLVNAIEMQEIVIAERKVQLLNDSISGLEQEQAYLWQHMVHAYHNFPCQQCLPHVISSLTQQRSLRQENIEGLRNNVADLLVYIDEMMESRGIVARTIEE